MPMRAQTTWALLSGAAFLATPAPTDAQSGVKEPGVKWEQTVEMQMQGMNMPPQTSTFCAPKANWKEPPKTSRDDGNCKTTEVKRDGPRMTWKMECQGKEPMTAEGEIIQKADGYTGHMTMHSSRGDMVMKMTGRNLGVECDAGETKRAAEAYKKQAEQAQASLATGQAQACEAAVQRMSPMIFTAYDGCKARQADFCARMDTRAGYMALMSNSTAEQSQAAKMCGKDPEGLRHRFCGESANALQAPGSTADPAKKSDLQFVSAQCPDESRTLAQRDCAGRSYTAEGMDPGLRDFCVKYGQHAQAKTVPSTATPQDAPQKGAGDAAKKAVKGLFGF
jgi:hypothetical protein